MYAKAFREIVAGRGVDYRECDIGREPMPFADNSFNFVTHTDVIEHHEFSPKPVLAEIHRVLAPGGRLILAIPNHASIYNRIRLFLGGSVNDEFDYFFNAVADAKTYDGHHREFTRSEIRSALEQADFRVLECRVIDNDLESLLNYRRRFGAARVISDSRGVVMRSFGELWSTLRIPFGCWSWAISEKLPAKQVGLLPTHTVESIQPEVT
jgi:SAM-dependent methyltransferase